MVIGPEAPLVKGVADVLREAGIAVFGPDAQGAQLEGSKTYSKEFMEENGIPTARYKSFTNKEEALAYCDELGAPLVVRRVRALSLQKRSTQHAQASRRVSRASSALRATP